MNILKDDISKELAERAFNGTSFSPEKRGEQVRQEYVEDLTEIYNSFKQCIEKAQGIYAEKLKEILDDEFPLFKTKYVQLYSFWLQAKSRCLSTMITGGSNFNVRRAEKANSSEDKRWQEFTQWKERALKNINKKFKEIGIQSEGGELEILKRKIIKAEKLQDFMKKSNAVIRKKVADEIKIKEIRELGKDFTVTEGTVKQLLIPDFAGREGFASYQLTNNNANIKRMKDRLVEMERREDLSGEAVLFKNDDIEIINNHDAERVQIFFKEIPTEEIRNQLKSQGWRWSPTNKAWQRKNTSQALYIAKEFYAKEVS